MWASRWLCARLRARVARPEEVQLNKEQDLALIPYYPGGICNIATEAWMKLVNKKKAGVAPPGTMQPSLPITFVAKVVDVRAHTSHLPRDPVACDTPVA